jgi:dipeptidyl aminopeptidase/acylaminoacyl peptidase
VSGGRAAGGLRGHGACRRGLVAAILGVLLCISSGAGARAPQGRSPAFTIDDLLALAHPGPPVWSPHGDRIAFARELDGALDLWWTSEDLDEPVAVTHEVDREPPARVGGFVWTAAGDELIYALRGDLFRYRVQDDTSEPLAAETAEESSPALSADGARLAYLRDGQVWVGSYPQLDGAVITAAEPSFRSLRWSPDGRYLVATFGASEQVVEDTAALMGPKMRFTRREARSGLAVIEVATGAVHRVEDGPAYAGEASFSPAGVLAWQEVSADAKRRTILTATAPEWSPRTVVEEYDDAWWTLTYLAAGPRWSPVDERFVFVSERDGWAHAWLLDTADPDAAPVQLTRGDFEVEEPEWSPDGARLLLSANRGSSSERGLQLLDVSEGVDALPEMEPISRLRGTSTYGRWRPDGGAIAFLHADPASPLDLWAQEPGPMPARQLSDTWPEAADENELVAPERARYASADGTLVPAQLFLPPDVDDIEGPVPAVVWAHGGGIRQNRYGWHPMRAYAVFYGFHQYLLQQGYAVVMVDYRGSIGYGRAFRQDQYLDLGGRDLDDVLAAVRYLRRLEEVDIGRIGVWGISYGGYLTLQALAQAPTAFDAGIDIAGVADWVDWSVDPGGLWIDGRMGSVEEHSELYRRSSPIHAVNQIARPLLILHGTADGNVPVLQTFKLTDAMVRAGKPFDLMIYPGEDHAFVRDRTWRDAFRRIEDFFDESLRK